MFRKNRISFLFILIGLAAFGLPPAFAQDTTTISGVVKLKKDGASKPVGGITVGCYNLSDFTAKTNIPCKSTTSDVEGKFTLSGLDAASKYILAISGPGIEGSVTLPVKPGSKDQQITVLPGEGKPLSKLEVWSGYANGGTSSDQKKAKVLLDAEIAARSESNEKIQQKNETIQASLTAGNNAFNSGNYDLAIVKYEEGIQADPEFIGSAPILLNNKGAALKKRAVNNYNAAIKSKDSDQIERSKVATLRDLSESLNSFSRAYSILSKAPASEISNQANHKKTVFTSLDGGRDAIRIMSVVQLADPERNDAAKLLTSKYIEAVSEKPKKGEALNNLAKYLMFAYDYEGAAAQFKKALAFSPKNPDILANLGISLYTAAAISNSRQQKQESLNYLSAYLKIAPKDHKMRSGVAETVKDLTTKDKLKPQKLR